MFAGCPRVGGQQHAGSAARPVPLVVPAGLLAACEWGRLCQLHLGRGWRSSASSLVVSVSACLEPSSIVFSPRTLFVSSRKSPMTAQALFLLWDPRPRDFFRDSGPLLHLWCLLRVQSPCPAGFPELGRAKSLEPLCQWRTKMGPDWISALGEILGRLCREAAQVRKDRCSPYPPPQLVGRGPACRGLV